MTFSDHKTQQQLAGGGKGINLPALCHSLISISHSIDSSKGLLRHCLTISQLFSMWVLMLESSESQVGFLKE